MRSLKFPLLLVTLAFAWIFISQPKLIGFAPGHHGWVSSHNLAIIENTTLKTGMVGYSVGYSTWENGQEKLDYNYFTRSPWIGMALQKGLLAPFSNTLAEQVHAARQMMNGVFLLCLLFSCTLLFKLFGTRREAVVAAVLLSFSGYYSLYFKDLIAPDLWTLLGFLTLLNAIAYFQKNRLLFSAVSLLVLSIGWGYSAAFLFLLWAVLETTTTRKIHPLSWLGVIGAGFVSAGTIFYQVWMEAKVKGVTLLETDVLHSALGRTRLVETQVISQLSWKDFALEQTRRVFSLGTPYVFKTIPKPITLLLLLAGIALGIWSFYKIRDRLTREGKLLWILLASIGFFWLIPMKGLSGPHHYTAMCYVGFYLALWSALFQKIPHKWDRAVLVGAVALFGTSVWMCDRDKKIEMEPFAQITLDFQAIRDAGVIPPGARVGMDASVSAIFQQIPYSPGFYLPGAWIATSKEHADVFLTREVKDNAFSVLSNNGTIFVGKGNSPIADLNP